MNDVTAAAKKIIANVEKVIVGKRRQIILSLVAWLVKATFWKTPGAKTMLA